MFHAVSQLLSRLAFVPRARILAVALAAAVFALGIGGYFLYRTPASQPPEPVAPPAPTSSASRENNTLGVGMLTSAQGPIDLVITDPDGFTITPTTIIPSELEFLREIPANNR